ncbi:MAG TPA: GIY-YIG nuclease family protein [Symbiobacteriaceae bacterium]|nr:GIY-YIG nuclease family protein [Symbiobacteriaceae bacterium]
MDRKELRRQARETKVEAGIYQIRNLQSGKVLVLSTRNLKTMNGKRFGLEMGGYINKQLQEDYTRLGRDAFAFEVLEVLEKPETGYFDEKDALKKLLTKWLHQLQPYGERGYNTGMEEE